MLIVHPNDLQKSELTQRSYTPEKEVSTAIPNIYKLVCPKKNGHQSESPKLVNVSGDDSGKLLGSRAVVNARTVSLLVYLLMTLYCTIHQQNMFDWEDILRIYTKLLAWYDRLDHG